MNNISCINLVYLHEISILLQKKKKIFFIKCFLNICNLYLLILTQLINPHQKDIYLHKKFTVYVYPIFAQIKRSIMKVICSKLCVFIITELHRRRHSVISPTIATWWSRTRFNRMEFPPRGRARKQCSQHPRSLMTLRPVTRLPRCHFQTVGADKFQDVPAFINHAIL